ncbi:entry exclusion lipoprotein TrbK [Pseudomonas frederiksbergensis]|uniref:entry exclusion lipoprotein TrbK n=1 Tax=Pseudomonas frederiksbergensis TaxID=104087 RepID=UPI003D1B4000
MRFLIFSISMLFAGLALADSTPGKKGYEVSDANCAPEHLKTLPDDAARQELVSKCLRRGEFKASPPKSW